jgi:hypothetical protein
MATRTKIMLPVLNPTTVDGTPITKEFIERYGPGLRGKPVNLDHNFDEKENVVSNIAIGEVSEVIITDESNMYAELEVFSDIYSAIRDEIKGSSFEWNHNPSGTDGVMKAIALCRVSNPKVEFARSKPLYEIFASVMPDLKSQQSDNMIDISKLTDEEKKELAVVLAPQVKEILASEMPPTPAEPPVEPQTPAEPTDEVSNKEVLDAIQKLTASIETNTKATEAVKKDVEILASSMPKGKGVPPAGNGSGGGEQQRSANLGL